MITFFIIYTIAITKFAIIKKRWRHVDLKNIFFKFRSVAKTLKRYLANHINLTKFAFFRIKIYFSKATSSIKIMNFSIGEIDMSMSFKLHQFLFLFTTIKLYTSMKRQPIFNKLMLQEVLSFHAANANSQRTVFKMNMPPSFLLWWMASSDLYSLFGPCGQ